MKTLQALQPNEVSRRLYGTGLRLKIGPFVFCVTTNVRLVVDSIKLLYADYPVLSDNAISDFHVSVTAPRNLRRWIKPQVNFSLDGFSPFTPLPADQAFAFLEWGINWVIASRAHQYLLIHSAVISKNGLAIILPAPPGSGKSTLCSGLVSRGWNLLSDEMALVEPESMQLVSIPRPVSLKNASIDIIRHYADNPVFGSVADDTSKGTVTHMKCQQNWLDNAAQTFTPRWIFFPKYRAGASTVAEKKEKAVTFMTIAQNSFNYSTLGQEGFEITRKLVDMTDGFDFEYSELDSAVEFFDQLER